MERVEGAAPEAAVQMDPARSRARESLLADRAAVARGRAQRGLRLRPPSSLPVPLAARRRAALSTGPGPA